MAESMAVTRQESEPRLYVALLGPMVVRWAERPLPVSLTQKSASLLAYFALRPGPHPRERLIDLF